MSASGRQQTSEDRRIGRSGLGTLEAEIPLLGAAPGESMPQAMGFQSPGLPYSIRKWLKELVGPPVLEPGTKGL
jgi:hypothetical protein